MTRRLPLAAATRMSSGASPRGTVMRLERRNRTFVGRKRRKEFERSLQEMRDIGLPEWALECYRRVARVSGQLPHEIVARVATDAAKDVVQDPKATASPTIYKDELSRLEAAFGVGLRSPWQTGPR